MELDFAEMRTELEEKIKGILERYPVQERKSSIKVILPSCVPCDVHECDFILKGKCTLALGKYSVKMRC